MSLRDRVKIQNLVLRCLAIGVGIAVGAGCVMALDRRASLPAPLAVRSTAQADNDVLLFAPADTKERYVAELPEWLGLPLMWPQSVVVGGSRLDRPPRASSAETASRAR